MDLIDVGVKPDNPAEALNNTKAINTAIEANPVNTRFVLPAGQIFIAHDPGPMGAERSGAIRFTGEKEGLELCGQGAAATRLVMVGPQSGGRTQIILVSRGSIPVSRGPRRITLRGFSIEHGDVSNLDPERVHNHIELDATAGDVTDVEIHDIYFGACLGDGIRLSGGLQPVPTLVRNTRIHHVTMRLGGHPQAIRGGARAGVSFQKGVRDVVLSDFFLIGARNSCLDMEPTTPSVMENVTITNGTIDNTEGKTWVAASFGGFEDAGREARLSNSRMVNVRIRGGALYVLSTRGTTLDNIEIDAARGDTTDALDAPLLLVKRANEDLTVRNVSILRDSACLPGPLVLVSHHGTSPRRINVEGGTWTTRVGPGTQLSYVDLLSADRIRIRGTRIRIEDTPPTTSYGFRVVPSLQDMTNIHLDGVAIESPDGLTAGFWFAATAARRIANIMVTGCSLAGSATSGILFDATGSPPVDRHPVVQGNDFATCAEVWSAARTAVNNVFPIIGGNRGGRVTLSGTAVPEGVVAAVQGSQYVRHNPAELWFKVTGTAATGWVKLVTVHSAQ